MNLQKTNQEISLILQSAESFLLEVEFGMSQNIKIHTR